MKVKSRFANAKEQHDMRWIHLRGLGKVRMDTMPASIVIEESSNMVDIGSSRGL